MVRYGKCDQKEGRFGVDASLDRVLFCMSKNAKHPKKVGRPEVIKRNELLARYKVLKQFLEHNWGRIGLELKRVRKPNDVRVTFQMVPGVEWCIPFRQDAPLGCLLRDGDVEVSWQELARTREQYEEANAIEYRLSSEYYPLRQSIDDVRNAVNVLISQAVVGIQFYQFFFAAFVAAEKLGFREVVASSSRLEAKLRDAQRRRQDLQAKLLSESAWYARNEIVRFARSRRHVGTPTTFAKAMAGLPEYGWLYSFRKCEQFRVVHVEYLYQLFQLLKVLTQKMKP